MKLIEYRINHIRRRCGQEYYTVRSYLLGFIPWLHFQQAGYETYDVTTYSSLEQAEEAITRHLWNKRVPKEKQLGQMVYRETPQVMLSLPPKEKTPEQIQDDLNLQQVISEVSDSPSKRFKDLHRWLSELKRFRDRP